MIGKPIRAGRTAVHRPFTDHRFPNIRQLRDAGHDG
ncbi:hypothetical protein Ae263Ps1_1704c [Pseudonocardia sp. Ae263_Ps1]|nr:hypothetical protein Ae263Ps1_1704c [Pseudonocardia sp. Ae263_Ps1]OLL95334.1 hypothetical protein Ae356Ps1_5231 [Pseudonocardia sp. Ae356_Ps1]